MGGPVEPVMQAEIEQFGGMIDDWQVSVLSWGSQPPALRTIISLFLIDVKRRFPTDSETPPEVWELFLRLFVSAMERTHSERPEWRSLYMPASQPYSISS